MAKNPDRFVWFIGADMTQPGAIGLGEMKSHVRCDGSEMQAVYSLAAEMNARC